MPGLDEVSYLGYFAPSAGTRRGVPVRSLSRCSFLQSPSPRRKNTSSHVLRTSVRKDQAQGADKVGADQNNSRPGLFVPFSDVQGMKGMK